MMKLLATAISALALVQIAATPVRADDLTDKRIEHLLRQLVAKNAPARTLAPIDLTAVVRVTGTIKITSQHLKLPLSCTLFFSDGNDHSEVKTTPVTVVGSVGTCTVVVPFKWTNADPADTISVSATVSNSQFGIFGIGEGAATDITRTASFDFPEMPLPLPGSTTALTFDTRI